MDLQNSKVLLPHKGRLLLLLIETLRGIMHKIISIGNVDNHNNFNEHIKSYNSYKRSCLIEEAMELQDKAMKNNIEQLYG